MIKEMTTSKLRKFFLEFFKEKGHKIIPSASLIPENDPTALFTAAGMHPLVQYLLGEKHPAGKRLVNVQKCLRTSDIDEVGDDWHLTFFEMFGNWSLGDYFKKEAIEWSFEFLTDKKWLGIPIEKLSITVFAGDTSTDSGQVPRDEETARIWQDLRIPKEKIYYLPKKDNWWGPVGETGPCGPCTEIFFNTGKEGCCSDCRPGCKCGKYSEIWNNVFMEFNKKADGTYEPLKQKNVDTGMGVERTIAVLNGYDNVYQTELFWSIIQKIEEISEKKYDESPEIKKAMRIVADHIKASVFIIADGVEPSNTGRGYVLRRLIRRARYYYDAITETKMEKSLWQLVERVISIYKDIYKELNLKKIDEVIMDEEMTFVAHLEFGRKFLEKIIKAENYISGGNAFLLYSTYGFPFELIFDIAKEKNIKVDIEGFKEKKKQHQELSRTASAGMFKGGLSGVGEEITKLHTATHLLLVVLRQILGNHVFQKGSNITIERLRFDFSYPEKMTPEQIKAVEDLVNQKIKDNFIVKCLEMSLDEAKKQGAMGIFEERYGERVKVYSIENPATGEIFSKEICAGPHVDFIGKLGHFQIIKEEAVSAGARRIKAILSSA